MGGPAGIVAVALLIPLTIAVFPREMRTPGIASRRVRFDPELRLRQSTLMPSASGATEASAWVWRSFWFYSLWPSGIARRQCNFCVYRSAAKRLKRRSCAGSRARDFGWLCFRFILYSLAICFFLAGIRNAVYGSVITLIYACRFLSGGAVLVACGLAVFNAFTLWGNGAIVGVSPMFGRWQLTHLIGLSLISVGLILVGFLLFRSNRWGGCRRDFSHAGQIRFASRQALARLFIGLGGRIVLWIAARFNELAARILTYGIRLPR